MHLEPFPTGDLAPGPRRLKQASGDAPSPIRFFFNGLGLAAKKRVPGDGTHSETRGRF